VTADVARYFTTAGRERTPGGYQPFFLRVNGTFMLLHVHGWPKIILHSHELTVIEDPFGLATSPKTRYG